MDAENRNEEAIFKAAIEIDSAIERAAFVKSACGEDAELLRRVEGLLKFHYDDNDFLKWPPAGADITLDSSPVTEGPGAKIGRYKLLQLIGEGGFGVVYMAEQEEPIRRKVALKIIKLGMDTKQVIARFEAERQALAMMEHPNIARVFDGGATDTGRPYFVMELVKGMPITEYCDKKNLDTQQRLELFIDVCKAVQHAHQKGIIHRDLKPSNVMITLSDDDSPVPKIIDFGIAKATQARLTEKTLFTGFKQFVGTPEYMSPEQARMGQLDVDTRSDIYSLGVLLYELLTGTTPFEAKQLRSAAFDEIIRIIREKEPDKPSTRLSALGDTLAEIAKHRHVEPAELCKIVRGDLDWIVMKSLEKDRARRYETASEFAQDIGRHLGDEPVVAGPPSKVYHLRKFARRHRTAIASGLLVATAIVMGLFVSTTMYFQAEQARRKETAARSEAEQAREKEAAARTEAVAARDKAQEAESVAQQQREQAQRLLARSQIDRGLRLLNEGDGMGLLDLLDACQTADDIPDLRAQASRLWAIAHDLWSDRLVQVLPCANHLAWSPDGRLFATTEEQTTQLWDTTTWQPLGQPFQLERLISAIVFSPDSKLLASHSVEGVSRLWDTATGQPIGPVLRSDDGMDKSSQEDYQLLEAWWSAAFSPDGKLLATACLDGTTRLWDTATGQPYGEPLRHEGAVKTVAFSPEGKLLASGGYDNTARLWEVTSGEPYGSPLQRRKNPEKVVFSPDGKLLVAIGNWDGSVGVWRADSGQLYKQWLLPELWDVAFSPDGGLLATSSARTAQFWETATGKAHGESMHHKGRVYRVTFSPDGRLLATGSIDKTMKLWEVPSAQPYGGSLYHHRPWKQMIAFSPNGRFLASLGNYATAQIWRTYQPLRTEVMPRSSVVDLGAVSPDGKVGAIVSGNVAHLWDTTTFKTLGKPLQHDGRISTVAFSPDGKLVATGSQDETVRLWDTTTGEQFGPSLESGRVEAIAFSPDGRFLAEGAQWWKAQVFEVNTGQRLHRFECNEQVWSVAFSPDGKVLATGARGGFVQLWDITTGQPLASPLQHEGRIWAIAFSPDGKLLATSSGAQGQTVQLWDISLGPPYLSLKLPPTAISGKEALESFSSDGTLLVGRLPGARARVWRVPDAPTDLREIQLRTWVALGSRRNHKEEVDVIQAAKWRELREELRLFKVRGSRTTWPRLTSGTDVSTIPDFTLTWMPVSDAVAYNVYWGTHSDTLKLSGQVGDACDVHLPTLDRDTTYGWRIDAVRSDGSIVKGDLWKGSYAGKLVGWWKLDETNGTIAHDSSGNGFDATVHLEGGAAIWDPNGGFDAQGCAKFAAQQYVLIPNAAWEQIGEKLSIAFWVNQDPCHPPGDNWPAAWGCAPTPGLSWTDPNWMQLRAFVPTPEGAIDIGKDEEIVWWLAGEADNYAGRWDHYVFIKDVNDHTITLYHNGVKVDKRFDTKEPMPEVNHFFLGGKVYPYADWHGRIDDFRIYNYSLSQVEVAALYWGEESGPIAGSKWVVDIGDEYYAASFLDPEKGDEYYVPLESAHDPREENLCRLEALNIGCRVLSGLEQPGNAQIWYERGTIYSRLEQWDKAEADYSKAIELNPEDWWYWHERGYVYMQLDKWEKVVADYTKAISLNPVHGTNYNRRALAYQALGQFDRAISDFTKAIELDPNNANVPYRRALAHLGMGDTKGYRKRCAQMLDHFGQTENAAAAHSVAWTCALAADAVEDFNRVVELAEFAIEKGGKTDQSLTALGAILYRAGRPDEAVQKLSGLATEWEQGKELPTQASPAYTWFFLAMAHHHLGHADESQRYFELAAKRANQEMTGTAGWNRKLTLQLLQAEAQSLLGVSEKSPLSQKEIGFEKRN